MEVKSMYPEATGGMLVRTKFLLDTPEGLGAFRRIKAGAVTQFSYGYDTIQSVPEVKEDGTAVRYLKEIRLWEYSPVVFAALPAARSISAKAIELKNPYGVFKEGDEYCVYKIDDSGDKTGESQGCHPTKDEATDQLAALEANVDEKSLGLYRTLDAVRSSFEEKYGIWSESDEPFRVVDVYDEYLLASSWKSPYVYKVGYEVVDDKYSFTDRGMWERGTLDFVPEGSDAAMEDEEDPDMAAEADELKHLRLMLETEQWELGKLIEAEAGPA
ncbi:MAG: hypothetical protein GF414_00565 [Candidatus Altiarchaeales archaeon]|nr:hypothetical protein [Candidatus Altiarchaeales archaeon]